jgi:hypothetical protein
VRPARLRHRHPEDDVWREDVEQVLQVAGFDRPVERVQRVSCFGRRNDPAWSAGGDVCPCPVGDLADRGRALADGFGDLLETLPCPPL